MELLSNLAPTVSCDLLMQVVNSVVRIHLCSVMVVHSGHRWPLLLLFHLSPKCEPWHPGKSLPHPSGAFPVLVALLGCAKGGNKGSMEAPFLRI